VIAFFITKDLSSPLLILGAALTGILTVTLTELIINTRLLKEDSAIGLIFPVFFATGVLLINRYAGQVHLDNDSVLLGEILHAPGYHLVINGLNLGPKALWIMGVILLVNLLLMLLFYKELKLATFDPGLATALGFSPIIIHYGLMSMVSITAVGAFDAVGSILVVALMITPPATAYLLTNRLYLMIIASLLIGILSAIAGCLAAFALDYISIAGAMATASGIFFLAAFIFSPRHGLVIQWLRHRRQKWTFACHMLTIHLLDHEGTKDEEEENSVSMLTGPHMRWTTAFASRVVEQSVNHGLVKREGERLFLTPLGRETARAVMAT
jgi:manganese/zinc/iron transport system permease protein